MLLILILAGCTTKKELVTSTETSTATESESTTNTEYVYVETIDTVIVPPDSSWLEMLYECDSLGRVHLKEIADLRIGSRSVPRIIVRDSIIRIDCGCDSVEFYSVQKELRQLKEQIAKESEVSSTELSVYEKIKKVRIPAWLWIGGAIALLIFIVNFVRKLKIF